MGEKPQFYQLNEKCFDWKKDIWCEYWGHLKCGSEPCVFHYQAPVLKSTTVFVSMQEADKHG